MATPLYKAVYNTVIERITNGDLKPGAMLPSETDLGAELNVSQGTARKALMELEQRGIVQRKQGRGTYVTVRTPENALFHFFRLRYPDGTQISPQLHTETVIRRKSNAVEKELLFENPRHVYEVSRVRTIDGQPLIHEISALPTKLFPGLRERAPLLNTIYVLYQQAYSCVIIRADEQIRAGTAPPQIAKALGLESFAPVLKIERLTFDLSDRPVERRVSTIATGNHSYHISLS